MNAAIPRLISEIMTHKLVVLHEEDNLATADEGVQRFSYRHFPVVDGNKLVGLVTERDLLRASVSTLDEDHALRDDNLKRYFFVREIMATELVTAPPDMPLSQAARLMKQHRIGCLPIVETDGTLVGIVTQSDFLGIAAQLLEAEPSVGSRERLAPTPPAHQRRATQ